ncbi:MAG: hypothetical protein LBR36_09340 [Bacteroidales bacterium]|nr:hypothetical protein [Bacteroidales bacterium]
MSKKIILCAGMLLFLWNTKAFCQSDTINRTDKFGKKYGYWEKRSKDTLLWKATFYNGEPIGAFIHYYPTKKVKDSLYYYPNSPKVSAISFYPNGKKMSEGVYINKEKDGKWLYYSQSGTLIADENYHLGKKNGLFKLFSAQEGILIQEKYWENNKLNGIYKDYYATGELRMEMHYKNNKIDGDYAEYYLNGKTWVKGQYINDLREGKWITYNENGFETKVQTIEHEQIKKTVLGFLAGKKWIMVSADTIAYFYDSPDGVVLQPKKSPAIQLTGKVSLYSISQLAGEELFFFLNESFLTSYNVIKKVEQSADNEMIITVKPDPPFDVFCYGDYLKLLKLLLNPNPMPAHADY